ncbi:HNH endonuclease [Nocardia testacea]|uniref:HNH endonuclease n=1 Tax=Nocardia testacea TaxID=248551 RepID=A0ABW7VQ39_9NOCA
MRERAEPGRRPPPRSVAEAHTEQFALIHAVIGLQRSVGNSAVSRVIAAQRALIVQREDPPTSGPLSPPEHANQRVGTWGTWNPTELRTGARHEKAFSSRDVAATFATSLSKAYAVFEEGTKFVLYPVSYPDWFSSFTHSGTRMYPNSPISNIKGIPDVRAFVTEDGTTILPHKYGNAAEYKDWMDQQDTLKPGANPFDNARQAFGEGLEDLTARDQFLEQFRLAMRASALGTLDRSQAEAAKRRESFGPGLPAQDAATIATVGKQLLEQDAEIERKEHAFAWSTAYARHDTTAEKAAHAQEMTELRVKRQATILGYPLLSRIDHFDDELGAPAGGPKVPTGNLATFLALPAATQAKQLIGATDDVDKAIATTRNNLMNGSLDVWALSNIVGATTSGLGITDKERLTWIQDEVRSAAATKKLEKEALELFQLAFGLAAMALTGGMAAVAFAGLAAGVGAVDAARATSEFAAAKAASETDINKDKGLVPADLVGKEADLVFAWIGVGLAFADAVVAVRAVKTASHGAIDVVKVETRDAIADVAKTRGVDAEALLAAAKAPPAPTVGALRTAMLEGLPPELAQRFKDVKVTILPKEKFLAYNDTAHAVTLIRTGPKGELIPEVIFRENGNAFAIREEAIHLQQLADPANAKKMALLSEEGQLGKWKELGVKDRLEVYQAKIDLELDAQVELRARPDISADELEEIEESIKHLQERQKQVEAAVADPQMVARGEAPWLTDDPPRLFNKPRLPRTGWWSGVKGDSIWYSNDPAVLAYARNGVPFSGGYPNFQQWAVAEVELPVMTGEAADFAVANRLLADQLTTHNIPGFTTIGGRPTASSVNKLLIERSWTWHHHHGSRRMILIPWELHDRVPHTGGASIARAAPR